MKKYRRCKSWISKCINVLNTFLTSLKCISNFMEGWNTCIFPKFGVHYQCYFHLLGSIARPKVAGAPEEFSTSPELFSARSTPNNKETTSILPSSILFRNNPWLSDFRALTSFFRVRSSVHSYIRAHA